MKINIEVDGEVVTATLLDKATAKDFAALLPLELTLDDYASAEKISDLPRRLSSAGASAGAEAAAGDLTYYSPWGNLAIFYKDHGFAHGLIRLGSIDAGAAILQRPGSLKMRIDRLQQPLARVYLRPLSVSPVALRTHPSLLAWP